MTQEDRLRQQLEFVIEIDRLKRVTRRVFLTDGSRRENDAEHSWHLAVMAVLLQEHVSDEDEEGDAPLDLTRTLHMLLIHDLVEIDAGDTFAFDKAAQAGKAERESKAADRIFAMLPSDQAVEWRGVWDEFEERRTKESRYAVALDRLLPIVQNYCSRGKAWREHGVRADQVLERLPDLIAICEPLGRLAERLIREAVERGDLSPSSGE
jgi:putative hydrolases of HD superfamily